MIVDDAVLAKKLSSLDETTFIEHGIYPTSGDCGNFAIALSNFVKEPGGFACSFGRELNLGIDDYPVHCALKWRGKMWDFEGIVPSKQSLMYDHADMTDFGDVDVVESERFPSFSTKFIDARKVDKIRKILVKEFGR
jgi:hypothetical protein